MYLTPPSDHLIHLTYLLVVEEEEAEEEEEC